VVVTVMMMRVTDLKKAKVKKKHGKKIIFGYFLTWLASFRMIEHLYPINGNSVVMSLFYLWVVRHVDSSTIVIN
jgi:hypothetical protein